MNLQQASERGNLKEVKRLLSEGEDVHVDVDYAFRHASYGGHLEVVKLLLAHGADVHAKNNQALGWASSKGHLEVVKLLLAHGADIYANQDYDAIKYAKINGHQEVVNYLSKQYMLDKLKELG
jgi:ankyrin repeat protein